MPQASDLFKQVAIKRETTYGVPPGATGAQLLRRVGFALNLAKDTYESNERRPDLQRADFRHGVRRVAGTLNGELSPGTYAPYLGSLLKRDFTATPDITGVAVTIAAGALGAYTITRAAGSWITDGLRIGQPVRLSGAGLNAANVAKSLLVAAMTATVLTVFPLNGTALVAEGPVASATVTSPGKRTFIPASGHTDQSYAIEEWFSDIGQSEVYCGNKFTSASIQLPPTGLATVALGVQGQDLKTRSTTRYFTSPAAAGTSGIVAAVNGLLCQGGAPIAALTGMTIEANANFTGDPVIGLNVVPTLFAGAVQVKGQFTAYFADAGLRDLFVDEVPTSLVVALTTDNTAAADFIAFAMTRVKVGSADKSDGAGGVVRTYSYEALLDTSGAGAEATTLSIYDSLA